MMRRINLFTHENYACFHSMFSILACAPILQDDKTAFDFALQCGNRDVVQLIQVRFVRVLMSSTSVTLFV